MTTLYDLLNKEELEEMIAEKRIAKQVHPNLPISIYNYTQRAQYANKWTNAERVCRGLIVEDSTLEVIARGPSKFFNYGQTGAPQINPTDSVRVTRKEDGSLGIGWYYYDGKEGHYGIATRGSFTSNQATHATELLTGDHEYDIFDCYSRDDTLIFEIVYPENRIVLDYGDRDELIPLGEVGNGSGLIEDRFTNVMIHPYGRYMTFAEALALPIPHDEEGYVLDVMELVYKMSGGYALTTGHVKLKGEEYKILHGLLTNTNARRIWVQLAARACHKYIKSDADWNRLLHHKAEDFNRIDTSKDIVDTFLTNVPDEFYNWVTKKIDSIQDRVDDLVAQARALAGQASLIDDKRSRYELVKDHPLCREILQFVERNNEESIILKAWVLAKPEGNDTPFRVDED